MKKYILLLLLSLSFLKSQSCDVCGCASGSSYLGILPQFNKNLIGVRQTYQRFNHPITSLNFNGESQVFSDHFLGSELWARYYINPKIQLFAFVPFRNHMRVESERTTQISGLGDIQLNGYYTFFKSEADTATKFTHVWMLGGGLRLPTGKYQQRDENGAMMPLPFQVGTGGHSQLLQSIYTVRYKGWGLNTDISYRFNHANELGYQLGNTFQSHISAFYWHQIPKKNRSLMPHLGINHERMGADSQFGVEKEYTGGSTTLATAGIDLYVGRWFMQSFVQVPLSLQVGVAQPRTSARAGLSVGWFF